MFNKCSICTGTYMYKCIPIRLRTIFFSDTTILPIGLINKFFDKFLSIYLYFFSVDNEHYDIISDG